MEDVQNKFNETIPENNNLVSGRKEILCEGYFYDVTDFINVHPGGTVIEYYTAKGEDATHAIQQFHKLSMEKVKLMMKCLKKRVASDSEIGLDEATLKKNRSLTEDFTKLYLELQSEGSFKPCYFQAFIRVMELFVIAAVGFFLFSKPNDVVKLIGMIFLLIARARCAFLTHEFGHYSYTGNPKVDRVFHLLFNGLVLGFSAQRWRRQHNRHHAMPQRLKRDVDLETMPILAYNAKVVRKPKEGKRFMIQNQVYMFVFDTLLVAVVWQMYLDPKFMLKRKNYPELIAVIGHFIIFYHIGFWPWLVTTWGGSLYLLLTFSLNHTFMPVTTEPTHWVEYSLVHTADVEHAPWLDWATGYLNYQIEHHLFPTMPNFRLPLVQDRVRALAKKHNLPYVVQSYSDAFRKVFKNMSDVSKEVSHLQ